jgi:hypothetical protein
MMYQNYNCMEYSPWQAIVFHIDKIFFALHGTGYVISVFIRFSIILSK